MNRSSVCALLTVATTWMLSWSAHAVAGETGRTAIAPAVVIDDVRLDETGSLHGTVLAADADLQGTQPAELQVRLWRGRQIQAAAAVARDGRFAFSNVPPGTYRLAFDRGGPASPHFCRVWAAATAPPAARAEIRLPLGGPPVPVVLRGQASGPWPLVSLPQAGTWLGVAAGAIAAPAVYHNTLMDNRPPASP